MSYFRAEIAPSPIEDLLNKIDAALADDLSPVPLPPAPLPTLHHFLEEEDLLRYCRSDNKRLISYISRPEIIAQLVETAFDVPPNDPIPQYNGSTSNSQSDQQSQQRARETATKHAYLASELLVLDNNDISDAVVSDHQAMLSIFSSFHSAQPGHLNNLIAVHFAKIFISLLKMRNAHTIQHITNHHTDFIDRLLLHIDSPPIADIFVRILDSTEAEAPYPPDSQSAAPKKPTDESLHLLTNSDVLGKLAETFVSVSIEQIVPTDVDIEQELDHETLMNGRRLREETMSNVTQAIVGLTERMLQFPELQLPVPQSMIPYTNAPVISRMLDAGLYASCRKPDGIPPASNLDEDTERAQAFIRGNNSALLHSLGLSAHLMTTEANVIRDDDEDLRRPHEFGHHPGIGGGRGHSVAKSFMGKGIGPSVKAGIIGISDNSNAKNSGDDEEKKMPKLTDILNKKVGESIIDADKLEAELSIRFARLAEMFDIPDQPDDVESLPPLGSRRLKLAEFFCACMKKGSNQTVDHIITLDVPKTLLTLFSEYQWSSMLHSVVTKSIVNALEREQFGRPARRAWFSAGLIPWLISAWSKNTRGEQASACGRAGYMGHLIQIGTALKGYLEESRDDPAADLPERKEMSKFSLFAEEILAPAHTLEATPLCNNHGDPDDGEDVRDVLDVTGISVVESLSDESLPKQTIHLSYSALKRNDDDDDIMDDDDEIKTVEVDDLGHFGADDDQPQPLQPIAAEKVFHPIPRESLSSAFDSLTNVTFSTEEGDELSGVINTVDSSSDDEGTYEAFVDDQAEAVVNEMSQHIHNLRLSESESAALSLAGAVTEITEVTEIEEPRPILPKPSHLRSMAAHVVSAAHADDVDDEEDSSDDDYEAWEDPERVETITSVTMVNSGNEVLHTHTTATTTNPTSTTRATTSTNETSSASSSRQPLKQPETDESQAEIVEAVETVVTVTSDNLDLRRPSPQQKGQGV